MEGRFVVDLDDDSGGQVGDLGGLEFRDEGLAESAVESDLIACADIILAIHNAHHVRIECRCSHPNRTLVADGRFWGV